VEGNRNHQNLNGLEAPPKEVNNIEPNQGHCDLEHQSLHVMIDILSE
jgi:hypothetical protein